MTVIEFPDLFEGERPDFRRKGGGAPLIRDHEGKTVTYRRPSSFAAPLEDRYHLDRWKARTHVRGAVMLDPTDRATLRELDPDDRSVRRQFDDLAELAFITGGGVDARNEGLAMHAVVEAWNLGQLDRDELDDDMGADLDAYISALERHGLTVDPAFVEHHVVCDLVRCAGTLDFVLTDANGLRRCGDLKTGGSVELAQVGHAVQEAIYVHGVSYDVVAEQRGAPLDVDQEVGLIVHLPRHQARCTIYTIDLVAGWEGALLAAEAKRWNHRKDLLRELPADLQLQLAESVRLAADGRPAPTRITPTPAPVAAGWQRPDDGLVVDGTKVGTQLADGFAKLGVTGPRHAAVIAWRNEAREAGRSFSFAERPCERTRDIYRAVGRLAAYCVELDGTTDDTMVRTLLGIVLSTEVQPATTIGCALGSLTIAEATSLRHLCDLLLEGGALMFEDDGTATVVAS